MSTTLDRSHREPWDRDGAAPGARAGYNNFMLDNVTYVNGRVQTKASLRGGSLGSRRPPFVSGWPADCRRRRQTHGAPSTPAFAGSSDEIRVGWPHDAYCASGRSPYQPRSFWATASSVARTILCMTQRRRGRLTSIQARPGLPKATFEL